MGTRPDYGTQRESAGFSWWVGSSQDALRALTGTPIREFNLDPGVCADCYRRGRALHRDLFGPDVPPPGLSTPAVSYGHANGLGCELLFPEGGEVNLLPIYDSLEDGLRRLEQPVDFATAGMAPFYLDFRGRLAEAFAGESVGFGYGLEGPLTTAYEVREIGFFCDLLDRPELAAVFLERLTDSILEFHRFQCQVLDLPVVNPHSAGLCDDLASFVPARLFGRLVVPFWDQYFCGFTSGTRHAHVEDLRVEQLPWLEEVGLWSYDPSISARLNPRLIAARCRVPFTWRIGEIHTPHLSEEDIAQTVFMAAADGATSVHLVISTPLCNEQGARRVAAFRQAGIEAKALLSAGAPRSELAQRVPPLRRERFWAHWPQLDTAFGAQADAE